MEAGCKAGRGRADFYRAGYRVAVFGGNFIHLYCWHVPIKGRHMDLTDRNNEKYTKLVKVNGYTYQVSFYYHKTSKDFMYWGIYPWSWTAEDYVKKNMQSHLIKLAEHDIKVRAGKGGNGQAGFGDVSPDKIYPKKDGRG